MDRVSAYRNLADNWFKCHCQPPRLISLKKIAGAAGFVSVLSLTACTGPFSSLDPGGPSASAAALLWWSMFSVAALVFVVVLALYLYALRRPADAEDDPRTARTSQRWIIGGGVLLPLVSISALLTFGIPVGRNMLPLPPVDGEAMRIDVIGHQWWWQVSYPESGITLINELHIPVNTPVDLHLSTADVIHSFWVPRLAGKLDMIPGRINLLRIAADMPGSYRGQCAEFCGLDHAHMHFTVEVHSAENFAAWLESVRD